MGTGRLIQIANNLAVTVAHVAQNAFYPHAANGIREELEFLGLTTASLAWSPGEREMRVRFYIG